MHNVHIAEWTLGLVTSRDRASSTAGDLAEEAAERGMLWFWSAVLRTAVSLLWRDVVENPVRVTGVAFIGLAIDVAASLLLAAISGVVFFVIAWQLHVQFKSMWWAIGLKTAGHLVPLIISLWVGRFLARWAPDCELGACLGYAIFVSTLSFILMFIPPEKDVAFSVLLWAFVGDAADRTLVLAGAVWGRHRRLAGR